MQLTPGPRKLLLATHLVASLGWAGALAGFLALSITGFVLADPATQNATHIAMDILTITVIVPLAFAALLTGIIQGLVTPWGLVRHYWVLFKLLIVATATYMLVLKTGAIADMAEVAVTGDLTSTSYNGARLSILGHAIGGLLVLIWAALLAIYKPRGQTPFANR